MKIMDLLQHSFILCILPYNQERLFLCLSKRTPYFLKCYLIMIFFLQYYHIFNVHVSSHIKSHRMRLPLLNSHRYDKVLESLYSFVIFFRGT